MSGVVSIIEQTLQPSAAAVGRGAHHVHGEVNEVKEGRKMFRVILVRFVRQIWTGLGAPRQTVQ